MSLASDIIPYLTSVPPFNQLPAPALESAARDLEISYHVNGTALGQFGHDGDASPGAMVDGVDDKADDGPGYADTDLYLIRAGAVMLRQSAGGDVLERRGEGEIFGHAIHFGGRPHTYSVTTAEDTLLWRLPARRVHQLCVRHPEFGRWLRNPPGERLHNAEEIRAVIHHISDLPLRAPVSAAPTLSVRECAQLMSQKNISSLPLLDGSQLAGIITDRDLRMRVLAPGLPVDIPVRQVMSPQPVTVSPQHNVESALLLMLRHGIHHLPVVDESGALHSVVSAGDLLRVHAPHPLRLVRDISRADNMAEVAKLARQGPQLLARLAGELRDVTQVGRIASLITDACTRRLLELGEDTLGPAPMAYTWLAFGSQARLEQGLISDQDNGMLLAHPPDSAAADYFAHLSRLVCDGLADCGYTHCKGGIMAMGEWRLSAAAWRDTFHSWISEPQPKSVMHCSIFFDMRPIYGAMHLAEQLRHQVLREASENHIFLRFLAAESLTHKPPLGFFRQFVQEYGGGHSHGLNLKQRGVIPVVDLARVLALEGELREVHTEERILAAAGAGLTTPADAANLIQAQRFINRVRLEHQARQAAAGLTPDHLVDPATLSTLHRRYLRSAFNVVRSAQQALAQRYML